MNSKDSLKDKLRALPQGFEDALTTAVLPNIADIPLPETEEAAVKAQGRLANYLLYVFDKMAGLPVLEVPLRIGQFVPAQHVLAAVGLEFVGLQEGGNIEMIMPVNGGVYYGAVTEVRCRVENVSAVTVDDGGETFDLSQETGNEWASLWAFAIGQHSITVTAGDASDTVSFEVLPYAVQPVDGTTVTEPQIPITLDPAGDDSITGVDVEIRYDDGTTDTVALSKAAQLFELAAAVYDLVKEGPIVLTFLIAKEYEEVRQESQIFWEKFEPPPA